MSDDPMFRLNACLKKTLGKPLTPEETEVIREVNRIQGWDKDGAPETPKLNLGHSISTNPPK